MILDDRDAIRRIDGQGACDALDALPAQCRLGRTFALEGAAPLARPRLVVLAGLGGSATSGDLLAACGRDSLEVPLLVHRGYGLPAAASSGTLVVATSYSGETEEVASAVETALARSLPVVVVTSGGALGRLAASRGLARVAVPGGLQPRMALGYLLFAGLAALRAAGIAVAPPGDVDEAIEVVEDLARALHPGRPAADNEAKQLALALGDRLPAIYGGPLTGPAAYRWKTDLAENAKMLALAGELPEMNHNEVEALRGPGAGGLHVVLLRDAGEPAQIAARFAALRAVVGDGAVRTTEVWSRGRGGLARLLSLVCLGAWASVYTAILRGVDPWPVPVLEALKRRVRVAAP